MKTILLVVGKTDDDYLSTGIKKYFDRLAHYAPTDLVVIPDIKNSKNLSENQQKQAEGQAILQQLQPTDHVVILDENGRQFASRQFADFYQKIALSGTRRLVFVIGGPFGFAPEVYARANTKISLSAMTFSHQLVRLIFAEQLYRAHTILRGEPYHHD